MSLPVPFRIARHELATLIRDAYAIDCGLEIYGGYDGPELAGDVEEWYPEAEAILARFDVVPKREVGR